MESMGDEAAPCLEPNPNPGSSHSDAVGDAKEVTFSPRLYFERYWAVEKSIEDFCKVSSVKKLLDVGCGNCYFMCCARNITSLTELYGVDIDTELLKCKADRLRPVRGWVGQKHDDTNIKVFAGSITDKDPVTLGTDVVTAIEVVEHLEEPVLEGFVSTVFDYIRPKLVIVTTPNSEYNVLFPNFSGMRHWDHKFEWNREQFQKWCGMVSSKYSYDVRYDGVGDPPAESASVGHCSQVAIFTLKDNNSCEQTTPSESATVYEEIYSTVYAGHHLTDNELVDRDLRITMWDIKCDYKENLKEDDPWYLRIPLDSLITYSRLEKLKVDMKGLIEGLKRLNYVLSDDEKHVVVDLDDHEPSEDEIALSDEDDQGVKDQGQGSEVLENCASGGSLDWPTPKEDWSLGVDANAGRSSDMPATEDDWSHFVDTNVWGPLDMPATEDDRSRRVDANAGGSWDRPATKND